MTDNSPTGDVHMDFLFFFFFFFYSWLRSLLNISHLFRTQFVCHVFVFCFFNGTYRNCALLLDLSKYLLLVPFRHLLT